MALKAALKHLLLVLALIVKIYAVPDLVQLNDSGDNENKFGKIIEFEGDNFDDGRIEATNEDFVGNGVAKDLHKILNDNQERRILNNFQFFGQRFVSNNNDDDDDDNNNIRVKVNSVHFQI